MTSDDVSRETGTSPAPPPAPPAAAAALFGERLPLAERYVAWLAEAGVERGLIGPRETPRLWDRHLLNSARLAELVPTGAHVADLGSGAGLPGLPLALARPDLRVTLVEPLQRRTTFLEEVVADLGLAPTVGVHRGRADALHGAATFDVVTSRALAPLPRLLDWSLPLVAPSGALLAIKGRSAAEEVAASASELAAWPITPPEVVELGAEPSTAVVVRVAWADPGRVSWPLPPGSRRPSRRPAGVSTKRRRRR